MKPAIPAATRFLADMMRNDIVPQLAGFRAGNVGMSAAMLDMIAEEWDVAAARLVTENREMHALLERVASYLGETVPLPPIDPEQLRVSALTETNEKLRARLIALHASIEEDDSGIASTLEAEIWALLRRSVESRRISSANF